jgi:hypothetical protein
VVKVMPEERIALAEETVKMLKDLGNQGQALVEEFTKSKTQAESLNKRMQEIQLALHGLSATATYLVGHEASKYTSSGKFVFNNADFTITVTRDEALPKEPDASIGSETSATVA